VEPDDLFRPKSLEDQLADHPEAAAYFDRVVELAREKGRPPAWMRLTAALNDMGLDITVNPVKRVFSERMR